MSKNMVHLTDNSRRTSRHKWGAVLVYLLGASVIFGALFLGDLRVEHRTKDWFTTMSKESGQHAVMEKKLREQEGQPIYDYITDTRAIAENACRKSQEAKETAEANKSEIARLWDWIKTRTSANHDNPG